MKHIYLLIFLILLGYVCFIICIYDIDRRFKILHKQVHNLEVWTTARTLDTCQLNFVRIKGETFIIHIEKITKEKKHRK
jgi:hypothetical protein